MKSECSEFQKKIVRSLMEGLTEEEQQGLEEHLAACPHCLAERESYLRTLDLMKSTDDKPVPRHFYVKTDEQRLNPWELFRLMKRRWQAVTVVFAGLFAIISVGWAVSLDRKDIDVAALKKDILKTVEEQNRTAKTTWIQEVRAEIARSQNDLTQQQQSQLEAALARLESRFNGHLKLTETRMKDYTQEMLVALNNKVDWQRTQDLNLINLRFESFQVKSAMKEQQTNVILDTLLQVAELRLK